MEQGTVQLRGEQLRKNYIRKGAGTNIFTAVAETDIALERGKLYVLSGRSGSGKTTLINILASLLKPDDGKLLFQEETDVYALDDEARSRLRNRHIGYIPQVSAAVGTLNVSENIRLPFTLYDEKADTEAVMTIMEQLGIAHLRDAMPAELSGGELRRVSIARALVKQPAILFADEPTGDLDDENMKNVIRMLRRCADEGVSVFISTHDEEPKAVADVCLRMDKGVIS